MKNYYRIMAGKGGMYADEAKAGNFIGVGFLPDIDLSTELGQSWREFNTKFIPVFLLQNPSKTKVAAGLACGTLWTLAQGILDGDIVLSPNGNGAYLVGAVEGDYEFVRGAILPHRRRVHWFSELRRSDLSQTLLNSAGSIGTISNLTKYTAELDRLISAPPVPISPNDETVEDPTIFALEKHLEDFLVANWKHTELGKQYDIYEIDGELVGQQYPSDTGPIDILAISKDRKEILVVELKKGRISDVVVGQIQRYMGYVQEELLDPGQQVKGVIIALEDDLRLRRALAVTQNINLMTYKVDFHLVQITRK